MALAQFEQGRRIEIKGTQYQLLNKVTDTTWQLQDVRTNRILEKEDFQLRDDYARGTLRFPSKREPIVQRADVLGTPHREVSHEALEIAKVRRRYVKAVMELPSTKTVITPTIHQLWLNLQQPKIEPSPSSVLRWKRRFILADEDIHILLDNHVAKGNRTARYPETVIEFANESIEHAFLTRERKTMQDVIDKAHALVIDENKLRPTNDQLPFPKRRLIRRLISQIPAYERHEKRYGAVAAKRKFRSALGHRLTAAPLERAEIDHTQLDLFVIDDDSGMPLGRPWVTACIDDYSRCILGIEVGFTPPSYASVARCLKNAFMPKSDLREHYTEIKNEWEAHGVMRELVVDNGLEFHSKALEDACLRLGIEVHFSARKTPWFKAKIERFLGTLNRNIAHGVPGTTFGNIFEKDDYDPVKSAVVRLSTLQLVLRKWIVDEYHQKPHRTLQAPPSQVWNESIRSEDIRIPADPTLLNIVMARSEVRKLAHDGIGLHGLRYNSHELSKLRMLLGHELKVEIRTDDSDLGHIIALSPDKKQRFKIPAVAFGYANGLSLWQHKLIRRYSDKQQKARNTTSWVEAKEAIARLIADETLIKSKNSRVTVARVKDEQRAASKEKLDDVLGGDNKFGEAVRDVLSQSDDAEVSTFNGNSQLFTSGSARVQIDDDLHFEPQIEQRQNQPLDE